MKRRIIMAVLLVAAAGGASSAWAHCPGDHAPGRADEERCGGEGRLPHGPGLDRLAERLGLSDAQRKQITAIFKTDREKNAPLMEKLAAYHKELQAAGKGTAFDEAAARTVATNLAKVEIELNVSRARVRSQINAVLTPGQRAVADKLPPPPMEEPGPGHRPPPDGCE